MSDDRKERNRDNQRRRRRGLMRIDYIPIEEAKLIIESERTRQGKGWCASEFLDHAVMAFAKANNLVSKAAVNSQVNTEMGQSHEDQQATTKKYNWR